MEFNRFDIAIGWYLYLSHYYDGMWSKEYERLCKLLKRFKPAPSLCLEDLNLDENFGARYVFINILERKGLPLPEELKEEFCDA